MATPTYQQWVDAYRRRMPQANDDEMRQAYRSRYGAPAGGPTFKQYEQAYRAKLPNTDKDEIKREFDKRYGISMGQAFKRQFKAGIGQMAQVAAGLSDYITPDSENAFERGARKVGKTLTGPQNQLPAEYSGNVIDRPSLLAKPQYWAGGIGQMLPSAAVTWGAGGLAAKGVAKIAGMKAGALAGTAAGGATGGAIEGASTYERAKEMGASEKDARQRGLQMGLGSAGLNALPFARAFTPGGRRVLGTALAEGVTEAAEEPLEAGILGTNMIQGLKEGATVFGPAALLGGGTAAVARPGDEQQAPQQRRDQAPDPAAEKANEQAIKVQKRANIQNREQAEAEAQALAAQEAMARSQELQRRGIAFTARPNLNLGQPGINPQQEQVANGQVQQQQRAPLSQQALQQASAERQAVSQQAGAGQVARPVPQPAGLGQSRAPFDPGDQIVDHPGDAQTIEARSARSADQAIGNQHRAAGAAARRQITPEQQAERDRLVQMSIAARRGAGQLAPALQAQAQAAPEQVTPPRPVQQQQIEQTQAIQRRHPTPLTVGERADEAATTPLKSQLREELAQKMRQRRNLLATSINLEALKTNQVSLVGKRITNEKDLADLAQQYRDPRWETARYLFTKKGKVVGHVGVSQRLPGSSAVYPPGDGPKWPIRQAHKHGADGVWLMHNHPSGIPSPSEADVLFTKQMARLMKDEGVSFNGHIVIDSNKFGVIRTDESGVTNTEIQELAGREGEPDTLLQSPPGKSHPLLGRTISNPADVAKISGELQSRADFPVLIGTSRGRVRAMMEIDPELLQHPARSRAALRNFARQNGSQHVFITNVENAGEYAQLLREGFTRDIIAKDGKSAQQDLWVTPSAFEWDGTGRVVARELQEPQGLERVKDEGPAPKQGYRVSPEQIAANPDEAADVDISINLDQLTNEPTIRHVVKTMADAYRDPINAVRRGTMSVDMTRAMAEEIGMTEAQLAKRKVGQAFNAEELMAGAELLRRSAKDLRAKAEKAAGGSDSDLVAFKQAELRHAAIQAQFTGATTEAGRALSILRNIAQDMDINTAKRVMDTFGGRERVEREALDDVNAESDAQIAQRTREHAKATPTMALMELWKNFILSGPVTHATNIAGGPLMMGLTQLERAVAAGVSRFTGADITMREVSARAHGIMHSGRAALRAGRQAWDSEVDNEAFLRTESLRPNAIAGATFGLSGKKGRAVDKLGRAVRSLGYRPLAFGDAMNRTLAERGELAALATRKAIKEGLSGEALGERVHALIKKPTADIVKGMKAEGDRILFTQPMGPVARAINQIRAEYPLLNLVLPFINTPTNIIKSAFRRTPLGPVFSKAQRADLLGKNGKDAQAQAISELLVGSGIILLAYNLALQGLITGDGPEDPNERAVWLQNNQPRSIRFGDTWMSYERLEPLSLLFGSVASSVELMDRLGQKEADEAAGTVMGAVMRNITSKTWVRGISEVMAVAMDPQRYSQSYLERFAGNIVPNFMAQAARVQDPTQREVDGYGAAIKARLPFARESLPPKINRLTGESLEYEGAAGPDILSPLYTRKADSDPMAAELERAEVFIGKPGGSIQGVALEAEEHQRYQELSGQMIRAGLEQLMQSPAYQMAPDFYKQQLLKKTVDKLRKDARTQLILENPSILARKGSK